jgi:hypothetical protein
VSIPIYADFEEDLRLYVLGWLSERGHRMPHDTPADVACLTFHTVKHRLIPPVPRQVIWSASLKRNPLALLHRPELEALAHEIRSGADLRPRQSKLFKRAGFRDMLLNDWGIHHLHLAPMPDGSASKLVVFVLVAARSVFMVEIADHSWFQHQRLVEIVHEDWPVLLKPWRFAGRGDVISLEERKNLRKNHGNALVTMPDGTAYLPPGGGCMSSGHNIFSVRDADLLLVNVADLLRRCQCNVDELKGAVETVRFVTLAELQLAIDFTPSAPCVVEVAHSVRFQNLVLGGI